MAARTRKTATPAIEETPVQDIVTEETGTMTTDVVDDVVETETAEPAKRGRKPDPVKAATTRFAEARKALAAAQEPRPSLEEAQAEFDEAKTALLALMDV